MSKVINSRPCPSVSMNKMNLMRCYRWYSYFLIKLLLNKVNHLADIINLNYKNEWKSRPSSPGGRAFDEGLEMLSIVFAHRWNRLALNQWTVVSQKHACIIVKANKYQRRVSGDSWKWNQVARWTYHKTSIGKQSNGTIRAE